MYTPIQNLTFQGQSLPDMRMITQAIKPYRIQAMFQTQLGMNELGIDVIVGPGDFQLSYACAQRDVLPDGKECDSQVQFRNYAGGEDYPYKSDVPSVPASFFSSTGKNRFMTHHVYDELIHAIDSATSHSAMKAAMHAFQQKVDEDAVMIPMFRYKYKDVFYRTSLPYTSHTFGSYHTGQTLGGFASVVKVV
jgi:ABC-type transport system substrate-binding protein